MKTVNTVSGGKTSAYIAANYDADYNVFSIVRTSDKNCILPDKKLRQIVSDKIGDEFIGPSEIMGKYANHIISDQSVIDMVDPSGGPYMTQGMKVFDKEIKEFKPHPDGYLIITI